MDPISVAGFIAAVVQLIDVTSKAVSYFNDVKNAPKDRAKLAREATYLLSLLTELRYRMEETTSTDPWFTGLRSLGGEGGPLMELKSALEVIADKLTPTTSSVNLGRVVSCWSLDKKEIAAILSKIERLKTLVGLALQEDHFKLSLAMKENITVGFQEMKTNQYKLSLAVKKDITVGFQEMKSNSDIEKINQWLAAPLPSSNHNNAMKKKQPRTGEWFTQSMEFADWKVGTRSFAWLHGIPGCGKTILCSTIIQDVVSHYQSEPTTAIVYFYFDFNDLDKQHTKNLICSLIVQLSAQCPHLPDFLQSAYSRSQNGQKQPTIEDLTILFRQILKIFKGTYILLDALDECTDREELLEFIEALMEWNIQDLHVLATSRKENDIATSLEPLVTFQQGIQSAQVDADIRIHILERLSNDLKLRKWPVDVQKEIEDALMKGAKGMFRWAVCQLDSIRKCLKLDALRRALNTLPKTLDDTYERILSNLDEEYKEDALKIFQWLCFSRRPMRIDEMVEVLAIDTTDTTDNFCFHPEQRLPDPCDILTICSTLVSVTAAAKDASTQTSRTQELRLAHFSVKEYLISDRLKKASMHRYHITPLCANVSIAKTCLTYLLHFKDPTILMNEVDYEFPLIGYATEFWPWHYRSITEGADRAAVDNLGYDLVENKESCFNWLRIFNPDGPRREINRSLRLEHTVPPLYYLSHEGVIGVLKMLLNKGADVDAEGGAHRNALSAASFNGHEEVVRILLEKGANVNAEGGKYGNALSAASFGGHEGMVRLLLKEGVDVNAEGRQYDSALSVASGWGYKGMVPLLLEKGANVNAEGGMLGNALSAASLAGHEEVVRLLLEKGANVNAERGVFGSALSTASAMNREGVVRLLLEKGANVNAEGRKYGSALSAASGLGYKEVVRLLLEKGADVNVQGGRALRNASKAGQEAVIRLLLENKADVNLVLDDDDDKALLGILVEDHEAVIQLLLKTFRKEG